MDLICELLEVLLASRPALCVNEPTELFDDRDQVQSAVESIPLLRTSRVHQRDGLVEECAELALQRFRRAIVGR